MKKLGFRDRRTNQDVSLIDCEVSKIITNNNTFIIKTSNKEIFETNYLILERGE